MEEIIFPNQIRMYRRLRGRSMQELADHLDVSLSAISKIEKGYRRVDQEQLVKFAEFLDCPIQNLFVNEQSSQQEVVLAWRREQERRNKLNERNGLKTLGAGLRQIRNEKNLTLIDVAENSDMTLSVYHRIEMGQREVSDKEYQNIAKSLGFDVDTLKNEIKKLDEAGALEEIIIHNDTKYKINNLPRVANDHSSYIDLEALKVPVFGASGANGSIIVDSSLDYAGLFLGQIAVNGLDGLNSGNVQFFLMNKANKYTFNEEKSWYEYKDTSDASYVSFASKWFDLSPSGFNYVSIKEANNEITIGMEMKFDDNETVYKSIQVTNIGNTSVTMLDEYLASLEEVTE